MLHKLTAFLAATCSFLSARAESPRGVTRASGISSQSGLSPWADVTPECSSRSCPEASEVCEACCVYSGITNTCGWELLADPANCAEAPVAHAIHTTTRSEKVFICESPVQGSRWSNANRPGSGTGYQEGKHPACQSKVMIFQVLREPILTAAQLFARLWSDGRRQTAISW